MSHTAQLIHPSRQMSHASLTDESAEYAAEINQVLQALTQRLQDNCPMGKVAQFHVKTLGRLNRSRLALVLAKALQLPPSEYVSWLVACECIHEASIIHDDVLDNDALRRAKPSIQAAFGVNSALLFGDWVLATAYEQAAKLPHNHQPQLMQLFAETVRTLISGQADELNHDTHQCLSLTEYEQIVIQKTGSLISLPLAGLHLIAKGTAMPASWRPLTDLLGVVYQIHNDLQNVMQSAPVATTPSQANDLIQGRLNSLLIANQLSGAAFINNAHAVSQLYENTNTWVRMLSLLTQYQNALNAKSFPVAHLPYPTLQLSVVKLTAQLLAESISLCQRFQVLNHDAPCE